MIFDDSKKESSEVFMKRNINVEGIGIINVIRNEFTGQWNFELDGRQFIKETRTTFILRNDGSDDIVIRINGNIFSGVKLDINKNQFVLSKPIAWYYYILVFIPLIFALAIGNTNPFAKSGIYFVGGAIGGGIGGFFTALALYASAMELKWYLKLLLVLFICLVAIGILFGIGMAIAK